MVVENKYLRRAIEKTGFVVLVKQYTKGQERSKLEYISPNATELGMNVELLNKGMRLSEDYIHPEDRPKVAKVIQEVLTTDVRDYMHSYRIVGDDGKVYNVSARVTIEAVDEAEGTYNFELCMQERDTLADHSTLQKVSENLPVYPARNSEESYERVKEQIGGNYPPQLLRLSKIMSEFAAMADLYSTYMDLEGDTKLPPVGPATNMGDFYDLFQSATYREYYKKMQKMVLDAGKPMVIERMEGGEGRFCLAPIRMGDEIIGFWVLGSYTPEETRKLIKVHKAQWELSDVLSEAVFHTLTVEVEAAKAKGAGKKLREELTKQNLLNTALTKINSKLNESLEQVVGETLREVAQNLHIDKAFLYTKNNNRRGFAIRSYCDILGESITEDNQDILPENIHELLEELPKEERCLVIDNSNMTESFKLAMMRYNFTALVAYPIRLNGRLYGSLVMAECKTERIWTKEELRFMQSISLIIQSMVENSDGDENVRNVNKHLIETYNNFQAGIFVKDLDSGEVLFSNKSMNKMVGRDFTGEDSRKILQSMHDRFDNVGGVKKLMKDRKTENWRSYIQELDAIMDITDVPMEWLQGENASLIIMRKAKDN